MGMNVQFLRQEEVSLLSLPNDEFLTSIEIINASGDQVYLGALKQGKNQIELPLLNKGIYMIIAWGNYKVKTENIVVN